MWIYDQKHTRIIVLLLPDGFLYIMEIFMSHDQDIMCLTYTKYYIYH